MTDPKIKRLSEIVAKAHARAVDEAVRMAEAGMTPAQAIRSTGIPFDKSDPSWEDAIFVLAYAWRRHCSDLPQAAFKERAKEPLPSRAFEAVLQENREPDKDRKLRKCLGGCGEMFDSESIRNRVCPNCTSRNRRRSSAIA
ncbi:MAG: hypothetical protein RH946_00625 [Rhodospirillales bacterium]